MLSSASLSESYAPTRSSAWPSPSPPSGKPSGSPARTSGNALCRQCVPGWGPAVHTHSPRPLSTSRAATASTALGSDVSLASCSSVGNSLRPTLSTQCRSMVRRNWQYSFSAVVSVHTSASSNMVSANTRSFKNKLLTPETPLSESLEMSRRLVGEALPDVLVGPRPLPRATSRSQSNSASTRPSAVEPLGFSTGHSVVKMLRYVSRPTPSTARPSSVQVRATANHSDRQARTRGALRRRCLRSRNCTE